MLDPRRPIDKRKPVAQARDSIGRLITLFLAAVFLVLGTGAAEYLHNAAHALEDARHAALEAATAAPGVPTDGHPHPLHDDSNCATHALLHAPLLAAGWVPLLVCLGLFIAFLTQLDSSIVSSRIPLRIACRGPPAC